MKPYISFDDALELFENSPELQFAVEKSDKSMLKNVLVQHGWNDSDDAVSEAMSRLRAYLYQS